MDSFSEAELKEFIEGIMTPVPSYSPENEGTLWCDYDMSLEVKTKILWYATMLNRYRSFHESLGWLGHYMNHGRWTATEMRVNQQRVRLSHNMGLHPPRYSYHFWKYVTQVQSRRHDKRIIQLADAADKTYLLRLEMES